MYVYSKMRLHTCPSPILTFDLSDEGNPQPPKAPNEATDGRRPSIFADQRRRKQSVADLTENITGEYVFVPSPESV